MLTGKSDDALKCTMCQRNRMNWKTKMKVGTILPQKFSDTYTLFCFFFFFALEVVCSLIWAISVSI